VPAVNAGDLAVTSSRRPTRATVEGRAYPDLRSLAHRQHRRGRGAQNGADEADGEDELKGEGLGIAELRAGKRRAQVSDIAEGDPQQQGRKEGPADLGCDVARDSTPGEIMLKGKGDADNGVQVRSRHRPHEENHGHN
jgi:hypothetical protein